MKPNFSFVLAATVALGLSATAVSAQQAADQPAAATPPVLLPAMNGPLSANPTPFKIDAGPLGDIYATGAVSGLGQWTHNFGPGDRRWVSDVANGQAFLNKTEGVFQFFVQAGAYSLPSLGTPYLKAGKAIDATYGPIPQAFIKIAPTDSFNVMIGKLPTLIGAEATFTFENRNIERGLLWNQEPAVSRGVQVNYTTGPLALSVSLNDGFYSERFSSVSGSATYTIDSSNTVAVVAGTNLGETRFSTSATPLLLNNQSIYNLIYTFSSGPWVIQPYLQYTRVPSLPRLGSPVATSTFGGALLAQYTVSEHVSLPVRVEGIASSGNARNGAPNLLYGPGSNAWSITVTPTVQYGRLFARLEGSYVKATDTVPGAAFGAAGNATSQARLLAEVGVLF